MSIIRRSAQLIVLCSLSISMPTVAKAQKPPLTLDEFFNAVDIRSVQISPDGKDVVIETMRPEWAANSFRDDLWLYRDESGGSLVQLSECRHDSSPQWSPDGRWIAFLSDRKVANSKPRSDDDAEGDQVENDTAQLYVISPSGGEALRVTLTNEEIHAFAWSGDSRRIYFATRDPWTKAQKNNYTAEWKDVIRFRETERGDVLFSVDVGSVVAKSPIHTDQGAGLSAPERLATIPYSVAEMVTSPDGRSLAIATDSRSGRLESHEPYGIFIADIANGALHLAIHTEEGVDAIHWALDSRHVFFTYEAGVPDEPYKEEVQTRLYCVDQTGGRAKRWASRFSGEIGVRYTADSDGDFAVMQDGAVLVAGRLGIEVKAYVEATTDTEFAKQPCWAGTYEMLSAARHAPRVAFVYSSPSRPREVYLAESPDQLDHAKPITAFNRRLTERELPRAKPYRWRADDGTEIEGMLIYPPGKFEAKHLPTFTWIHGGPQMADGDEFRSPHPWAWFALAATRGWLVFDANYRGSTGYGDAFTIGFVPRLNSRPGKDILEGVDALVKDGIADPEQLTVGGYSEGGFLTNWLITQTPRFKAAVTGAGAVENVAMWGNSGAPLYFAHSLGGPPWDAETNYNREAAIWQIGKATTPTLIITGSEDSNVPPFEAYLLEHALYARRVPHRLLIFPGEGHSFDKDPWHLKIAVREELKWLEKYGRKDE
ncbi:MAG TPA: S9 family peptidase [Candidatus Acidoferrales bacterium]|nr:S9 family peptidase [Candidatus Acidoferrales bacterium]